MMFAIRLTSILLGAGLIAAATAAAAADAVQEQSDFSIPQFYGRGKNVSVLERERPDYDAVGIHTGGFTVFPKMETGLIASSNILAVQNHPQSDVGVYFNPSITAQSNWGRHSLSVAANVDTTVFSRLQSENTTTYALRADGRLDVHDESYINIGGDVDRQVIPRGGTITSNNEAKPVPYDTQGVYARGVYGVDRVRATLEGQFRNFNYFNVPQTGGGTVDESIRDLYQDSLMARFEYALSPDAAVFGSATTFSETYDKGNPLFRRNSTESRFLAGANFDLTALARGEIGVGYVDRQYKLSAYRPLKGLAISSKIEYFPTQLVTITFIGQRLVEDAAFSQASGYFENYASLGADYEFKRNIILSALGSLEHDTFQGVTRTDNVSTIAASGKYLVNRYVGLGTNLAYTHRESSASSSLNLGPIYNEVRFTVSLVLQR